MKRKVYVMDCGDFVKIGVSGNVEQRATQIPYKVNRIYSTDEMEDAFKLEHEMHVMFCKDRVPDALGREYFNIPFDAAVSELEKKVSDINASNKDNSDNLRYKHLTQVLSMLEYLDEYTLGYIFGRAMVKKERGEGSPNLLTDTIKKLCDLPEDKKHYILGYMDGIIDCSDSDQKKEENKKGV